ncbi:MAG: glucose-1-phosphate adenylyltransferase [Actinomycetes bacterium]|jgi:glucose-1-phosphate adenylyltransferase
MNPHADEATNTDRSDYVVTVQKEPHVLGIVLAGGEGKRLMPLTADRAKPAVPFGGAYRLIDFVLSNMVNAGYMRICVLTQYKSHSLDRHITTTWRMSAMVGDYVTPVPAQQRLGPHWFTGSADAIFQSLNLVYDEKPDIVCVFGADNIYRMDPRQMVEQHIESGAGVTVAGIRVPRSEASAFGIIETEADGKRIKDFLEKPADPPAIPGSPDEAYVSMGNYVFSTDTLLEVIRADAEDEDSAHDMGGNIIPMLTAQGRSFVYDFADNKVPGATERDAGYWRDVGTIDAYYDANMDLVNVNPTFNLYNRYWPILGHLPPLPPAKFVLGATADNSMICAGSIITGAHISDSVLGYDVHIGDGTRVDGGVIMPGTRIGKGATIRRAVIDKYCEISDGTEIGIDHDADRARGFTVSDGGVTVLGKGTVV